jgi:predicted DNA-binding transcriptional regulator AlpA
MKNGSTKWMTISEVCCELEVARSTVDLWRRLGRFPKTIRLPNGAIRISISELEAWTETLEETR